MIFFRPCVCSKVSDFILTVVQISDTSGVQFRQTSELVDLTKSTAVSVEGASQGILNLEQKADIIIGALPQIQQGVTQFTSDVPILCSSFTSMEQIMEQRIQAVEGFTSRILPDFQTKLDQLPLRIRETLAECTASAGSRPSVETPGINSIKSAMSTTLTEMVLLFDRYIMKRRLQSVRTRWRKSFNLLWLRDPVYYGLFAIKRAISR